MTLAANRNTSHIRHFYVYAWYRPNGVICYVGKGMGQRIHAHKGRCHNVHLKSIITKGGATCSFLHKSLTEQEAHALEKVEIAKYRRIRDGGTLVNFTDGGDGASGHPRPKNAEWRAKIAATLKGYKHSDEFKAKISARGKGRKISEKQIAILQAARWAKPQNAKARENMSRAQFRRHGRFQTQLVLDLV